MKEIELPISGSGFVPDATLVRLAAHAWPSPPRTPDGRLRLVIQALVLESRGRRIVMDTCIGNERERTMSPLNYLSTGFLADFAPAGCPQLRSFVQDARVTPPPAWRIG